MVEEVARQGNVTTRSDVHVVIEPDPGWTLNLAELWAYRDLARALISREIKSRYRQMALGWLWIVVNPLVNMVVLSLVFGQLAKLPSDDLPYTIFLYAATMPWTFFTNVTESATGSLRSFVGWMSKIYFPPMIAPVVQVVVGLVDWMMQLVILIFLLLYYHIPITINWLAVPLYLCCALIVALGVGMWASGLSVIYRDFANVIRYGMMVWYYLTPVIYSSSLVPESWEWVYELNPMYWVVEGFRWALLGKGTTPEPTMLIPMGIFAILLISGMYVFQRVSRNVVDIM